MHPVLFEINTPDFLKGIFSDTITIYSYGFLIAIGAFLAYYYTAYHAKRQFGLSYDKSQTLIILIIIAAVVGGKFFIFFEKPDVYFSDPGKIFENFSTGFVFYGSLIFAIPTIYFFLKANKLPILSFMDIIAGTACIVHGLGRLGCFFGGCCYGIPTDSFLGMPFDTGGGNIQHVHPTQFYSFLLISGIFVYLQFLKKRQQFPGQLFFTYIILYGMGRAIIEFFRGDESRGYVIEDVLTNSQLISIILISMAVYLYYRFKNKASLVEKN